MVVDWWWWWCWWWYWYFCAVNSDGYLTVFSTCTSLLRAPVSEMTYTVSSGTLNSTIPYHTIPYLNVVDLVSLDLAALT